MYRPIGIKFGHVVAGIIVSVVLLTAGGWFA
jgi:hypothetical protein